MNNIFIGMLLIFLNFNITIGSSLIGLIPTFLGYIFIVRGLSELTGLSNWFSKILPYVKYMVLYSGLCYAMDLFGISAMIGAPVSFVLGLISIIVSFFISYNIIMGIKNIETTRMQNLNSRQLYNTWKLLVVTSLTACIFYFIETTVSAIFIVLGFAMAVYYLYIFSKTKKLFYSDTSAHILQKDNAITMPDIEKNKKSNKCYKIALWLSATFIIATIITILSLNIATVTIHDDNMAEIKAAIAKTLNNKQIDDIEIIKMTKESGHWFVLYKNNNTGNIGLTVFQPYGIFANQYRAFATDYLKAPKQIGKNHHYGAYKGLPEPLIMIYVYGVNTDRQIYSYTLFMTDGLEYSRIIEEEDYFIHVYYVDRFKFSDNVGQFYNKDGEYIGLI